MNQQVVSIVMLVGMLILMYLLLIRPQRRQEKQVAEMRSKLKVGDEVITIGGFFGRVVKIKDEVLTLQLGGDGTKVEVAKWAISKVADPADRKAPADPKAAPKEEKKEEPKGNAEAVRPKSLKKAERKEESEE